MTDYDQLVKGSAMQAWENSMTSLREDQKQAIERKQHRRDALLTGATAGLVAGAMMRPQQQSEIYYPAPLEDFETIQLRRENLKATGNLLNAQADLAIRQTDLVDVKIAMAKIELERAIEQDREIRERKAKNRSRNRRYKAHGR